MLMSVVDRHSAPDIPVTEIISQAAPSLNQQIYLRLRLALSLNLRRQILIAVCDDTALRNQLATQIESDMITDPLHAASRFSSLDLNLENPDVLEQIRRLIQPGTCMPNFQITGIDRLTRQPVNIQRTFLESLSTIAQQLPHSEFNLLLWVTRPWCRAIQQSVPDFWNWHTGLFEFEGDPFEHNSISIQPASNGSSNGHSNGQHKSKLDSELADSVLASVMRTTDLDDHAITAGLATTHPDAEPWRILQQIEALHQTRSPVGTVAALYRQLGDWYRDRLDSVRPDAQSLTIIICAYEQALKLVDMKSEEVPDLLNDIANLYWIKARSGSGSVAANLEKALKAYQFAVDRTHPEVQPQTYAMIQNNLGSVYSDLSAHRSPQENLQSAIAAYQASIQYRAFETDPARYAATQNNLGTAYWNLAQHQSPMVNLQSAVSRIQRSATLLHARPRAAPLCNAAKQSWHSVLESIAL